MCFTANDDYQNFLVFVPVLCSLTLGSNKEVTNWISTRISFSKVKPFNINLDDMYLVHGKVVNLISLFWCKKSLLRCLVTLF